jgi:hypothetical protein
MSGCGTFRRYRIQATVLLLREERPCLPGKPIEPKIKEFLKYVLSREGQEEVIPLKNCN